MAITGQQAEALPRPAAHATGTDAEFTYSPPEQPL